MISSDFIEIESSMAEIPCLKYASSLTSPFISESICFIYSDYRVPDIVLHKLVIAIFFIIHHHQRLTSVAPTSHNKREM